MFVGLLLIIVVVGIVSALAREIRKAKHIVSIIETGQTHYYRGACMVCFEIRYDDGTTKHDWAQLDSMSYRMYKNWNTNNKK